MDSQLDNVPCLYFSTSDDGAVLEVNEMFCSTLGFSKEELIGKKTDLFFPVATRIFFQTHFFPLLKMHGHATEIFISLQSKTGKLFPLLMNADRRLEGGSAVIRCIGILVHNRKKYEDELVAARNTAEAALRENTSLQQMKASMQQHFEQLEQHMRRTMHQHEELMQFNRVVTHDLQEPLRKMSIFSNLLLDGSDKWQDTTSYVQKLVRSMEQMRSIVSGLQEYVWITEVKAQPSIVDLDALLSEVLEKVKKENGGIPIGWTAENLPPVQADPAQLQLLFYHVLSNAVRYRNEQTGLSLKLQGTVMQKNRFVAVKEKYNYTDHLRVQVTDNGVGFDPAYREEVFRLFGRLHAHSGRGVGLALCKKVMENHGGTISIDSKPGGGTTIIIILPMQQA